MPARRDLSTGGGAGVRKPPGKEPAVGGAGGGRLWRFGGAASCAGAALAGVIGDGSPNAVESLSSRRLLTGRFWQDRWRRASVRSRRGDSDAMPEGRFSGRRVVR